MKLPPGPTAGRLAQSALLARDPLRALTRARSRYGPVFTLRLVSGPLVVVALPGEVERLTGADPERAHAGETRRTILPMASPRSVFGADGEQHRIARRRLEPAFAAEALDSRAADIAALARRHAARWPAARPFRLLPRLRTLADEIFASVVLGIEDDARRAAIVAAMRRMIWTPGNPPVPPPSRGALGRGVLAAFERRKAPLARLLTQEVEIRRRGGPTDGRDAISLLAAEPSLSPPEIVDELLAVLMAAQEPPAIALTNVLHRLGRDGAPGESAIREVLRLRPPAMASLRRLTEPAVVGEFELPAGTDVMLPIPLIQRESDVFFPFGGGSRRCIGQALAEAELHAVVPAVLERLRIRPAWPREERLVQRATVLVPHRSALVVATRR